MESILLEFPIMNHKLQFDNRLLFDYSKKCRLKYLNVGKTGQIEEVSKLCCSTLIIGVCIPYQKTFALLSLKRNSAYRIDEHCLSQ